LKILAPSRFRNAVLSLPAMFLWPNLFGVLISSLIFCCLQFGLPVLQNFESRSRTDLSQEDVCQFIEIFLLGTNAGLTKLEALQLVFDTATEPLQSEIVSAIGRCNLGVGLVPSLSYTAEKYPELAPAIKAISRSEITGAPISAALELELMLTRSQAANDVLQRVRSLSVKCVLPLGLCFLPAFFLLAIVPIIASLLPSIFSTLK